MANESSTEIGFPYGLKLPPNHSELQGTSCKVLIDDMPRC